MQKDTDRANLPGEAFASMPNAGFVSETIDPGSYGQRYRNMILGGFLPLGFRYKLASLGLLGKMSGQDLALKCIIGVAAEA